MILVVFSNFLRILILRFNMWHHRKHSLSLVLMLIDPFAQFINSDGSLMYEDLFTALYCTIFIQCPLTDLIVHPEHWDIHVVILFESLGENYKIVFQIKNIHYSFGCIVEIGCFIWYTILWHLFKCDADGLNKFQTFRFFHFLCQSVFNCFSCFRFHVLPNGSVSFLIVILNDLVYPLRALLFSSIFVLDAVTGTTFFIVLGLGVGFHASQNSIGALRNNIIFIFLHHLFDTFSWCWNWS